MRVQLRITAILLTVSWFAYGFTGDESLGRKRPFGNDWKFALGDQRDASTVDCDDANWRVLDLPHDWSIEGVVDQMNPTGGAGGYFPAGLGWYRKKFTVPSSWHGKRVSIYFEGVYSNAELFCNGMSLGIHPYGYTSFSYDLTPHLQYDKDNFVAVRVDNSEQVNCRWYSGSGIYRHVWLFVTGPIHIGQWGVVITTPEVNPKRAAVRIATQVKNETTLPQNVVLSTQLRDKNGKGVGNAKVRVALPAHSEKEVVQTITVHSPQLWSPETPCLYEAQLTIIQGNKARDVSRNSFGIRSLRFSAESGFQLNDETVKLAGGCVHHDNGCLGAAAYDRAEERRVELLKSAGFNAVRTSHNPPSEAFLDACDRLGLMVIDESFDGWRNSKNTYDYARFFDEWWQRDLESMVMRDRNHPSIIMWSIGNEIIERKKPEAVETARKLAGCVHKLDPTRPVSSAMTTWDKEWEMFDTLMAAHDVCGYNYQLDRAPSDHARVPSRIILQTESFPRDAFANWKMVRDHDYIIGDIVWTALDYLGESGIGRYYYPGETKGEHWEADLFPWHGAYCGDIDLMGWRKPISHYRSMLWTNQEKLYMAVREPNPENGEIKGTSWSVWPTWESWTWPGQEGKDMQVEVYSKYPKVRLYLNNSLIAELPTTESQKYVATFTLPYAPGLLKAVGVQDSNELESTTLKTAGKPANIRLIADRTEISTNGQDLSFVTVEIVDENGNIQPNAENPLQFTTRGPGKIVGVDNANLKDLDCYAGHTRKAWHGRAMVVIMSGRLAGDIELEASSPGLPAARVTIRSRRN